NFDHILERAEKQVARSVGVVDIPPGEGTIRLRRGALLPARELGQLIGSLARQRAFDLGNRISDFLSSSLTPRTLAWSAPAAAVVIFVQAAVITALLIKERDASSGPSPATPVFAEPPMSTALGPGVAVQEMPLAAAPAEAFSPRKQNLSDEEIAALVAGG